METNNQNAAPQPGTALLIAEAEAYSATLTEALGEQSSQMLDLYGALIEQTLDVAFELYDLLVNDESEEPTEALAAMKEEVLENLRQKLADTATASAATTVPTPEMAATNGDDGSMLATFKKGMNMGMMNEVTAHQQFQITLQAASVQTITLILSLVPEVIAKRVSAQEGE